MSQAYLRAVPSFCITHKATHLEEGRTLKNREEKVAKYAGRIFQASVGEFIAAAIGDGYLKGPAVVIILLNCGT